MGHPFSNVQRGGYLASNILLTIVKMIEDINLLLLLTMFGSTCYVYYRLKKIFYLISIVMDSEILDQLTNLGKDVDSEFPKPKRGRKKKADTKINELDDNDMKDKRERLVACILSGNSKMYLRKEYTEQQINEMDCNSVNALLNRYESVLSAQMTKSLGKSVINLYSNLACSVLGIGNQQELSTDLQSVSWILAEFYFNRGLQRLYTGTCIILQKTINGFPCLLIVFLKSKTYQLILKDVIKLNRNLR